MIIYFDGDGDGNFFNFLSKIMDLWRECTFSIIVRLYTGSYCEKLHRAKLTTSAYHFSGLIGGWKKDNIVWVEFGFVVLEDNIVWVEFGFVVLKFIVLGSSYRYR